MLYNTIIGGTGLILLTTGLPLMWVSLVFLYDKFRNKKYE